MESVTDVRYQARNSISLIPLPILRRVHINQNASSNVVDAHCPVASVIDMNGEDPVSSVKGVVVVVRQEKAHRRLHHNRVQRLSRDPYTTLEDSLKRVPKSAGKDRASEPLLGL